MINYIKSLEYYFNLTKKGGYNDVVSKHDDNETIRNYMDKINQYKLFIKMLRNYSIQNDSIKNNIILYQNYIKNILESIKKLLYESKNITIDSLPYNNIMNNKLNLIIDDDIDGTINHENNLKKKCF